jgi:hypothetical protein
MNATVSALLILVLLPLQQQSFVLFSYCHEYSVGLYEKQCIELKPDGTGQSIFKRRDSDPISAPVTLSPAGRSKFLSIIAATRNLADAQKYESSKKVANLGMKVVVLETESERKEAKYNYSELKDVTALTTFFDALLNQYVMSADIQLAARYERLSIPERLDEFDRQLKANRFGDPPGLIPVLDGLIVNDRILQYAREHAQELKDRILRSK